MPPKKNGKDIKMVMRAKLCNEAELAHALDDAISSSHPEAEVLSKHSRVEFPKSLDEPGPSGSRGLAPKKRKSAKNKRPRSPSYDSCSSSSRNSSLESRSPRRESRHVHSGRPKWTDSTCSSSSGLSSADEELQQERHKRRRSSYSGRSRVTSKRGYKHRSKRRLSKSSRTHTRKSIPAPRSPARLDLPTPSSSQGQVTQSQPPPIRGGTPEQVEAHDNVSINGRNSFQKEIQESSKASKKQTPPEDNSASHGSGLSHQNQIGETDAGDVTNEERTPRVPVPVLPASENTSQNRIQALKEKVAVLQRQIKKLEKAKADSDDHALELSKQLEALKGGNEFARVQFSEVDLFDITSADMDRLSDRASSDSMFVGLLLMAILGPDRLQNMSATGQRSRRFSKKLNADGTPAYPAAEAIDKKLMVFLCDKVAERNQMRLGPSKIASIRAACTEKKIRKYVTQKLSNHKRTARERSQQNEQ